MLTGKELTVKYTREISKLTGNSKLIINFLTTLAKDNLQHASIIVSIIEHRLRQTKPEWKLLFLYLVDSIVKNVGQPFIDLFSRNIVSNVRHTYLQMPEATKVKLLKLRQTWRSVFSLHILSQIDQICSQNHTTPPPYRAHHPTSRSCLVHPTSATYSPSSDFTEALNGISMSEAQLRQHILLREKELLEIQRKKRELQIKLTEAQFVVADHGEAELGASEEFEGLFMEQQKQPTEAAPVTLSSDVPTSLPSSYNPVRPFHSILPQMHLQSQQKSTNDQGVDSGDTNLEDKENEPGKEKEVSISAASVVSQLISLGIIPSPSESEGSNSNEPSKGEDSEEMSQELTEPEKSVNSPKVSSPPPVEVINMNFENMRDRRDTLIDQLFTGMKCTSCGIRFQKDQRDRYSEHLDWHFRKNRRKRSRSTKILSRKWYCNLSEWYQFIELEDTEERAPSMFATQHVVQEEQCSKSKKRKKDIIEQPVTLPAAGHDRSTTCPHCNEGFEMYYDHDSEDWKFKNACLGNGDDGGVQVFHAQCLQDYLLGIEGSSIISTLTTNSEDNHVESTTLVKEEIVDDTTVEVKASQDIVSQDEPKSILEVVKQVPSSDVSNEMVVTEKDTSDQLDIICISEPVHYKSPVHEIEMDTGENVHEIKSESSFTKPLRIKIQDTIVHKKSEPFVDTNNTTSQEEEEMEVAVQERKFIFPKPRLDQNTGLKNIPPRTSSKLEVSGLCTIM